MFMEAKMVIGNNIIKVTACAISLIGLTACSGTRSESVVELTQNDKYMDCTELQLEITEAKFLMDKAEKNRGASIKNILMPLSYPSTFFSAGDAIDASSGRIDYLKRLSEIKGCNNQRQASVGSGYPSRNYSDQDSSYNGAAAGMSGGYPGGLN